MLIFHIYREYSECYGIFVSRKFPLFLCLSEKIQKAFADLIAGNVSVVNSVRLMYSVDSVAWKKALLWYLMLCTIRQRGFGRDES